MTATVERACGAEPSWLCARVLDWTGNAFLARSADVLIATPGRILLIVLVALVASAVARRLIGRVVRHMRGPAPTTRFRRTVGRTVTKGLFDDRPQSLQRRRQRADAIGGLLRGLALFLIWIVAGWAVLEHFQIDVRPLLAGAGILGIALGFGAQNLVRDLLSGVFMLVEDQYGVGDVIDVGRTAGVVEGVGLRVTRLRDVNGILWHVPNGTIEAVGNMSQEWSRALLDIQVAYGTDISHAKHVIKGVADQMWRDDPDWSDLVLAEPEIWGVEELGTNGITIRLVVRTKPIEQWNVARELRARLVDAFSREAIEIPFAQQVVWLRHLGDDETHASQTPVDGRTPTRPREPEPESPAESREEEAGETVADAADEGDRMPPPDVPGGSQD